MGFRKSRSSVKVTLESMTHLPQLVEKALVLESENTKLRHHVMVLSRRLHKVMATLKAQMAGAVVVEDVAMVEEVVKGEEVAVVAEGVDDRVSSWEEDWTMVRRKVREKKEVRRSRRLEEEQDVVWKRMKVLRLGKVLADNTPMGPRGVRVVRPVGGDRVVGCDNGFVHRVVGSGGAGGVSSVALVAPVGAPRGPATYQGVSLGSERWRGVSSGGFVPKGLRG
ncbi:hypothetical protein HOY80DRAFT_1000046 [Tuber brumale]|nr:hypothetical protein HOY80DRAFT_1000046 [Tuber brumale]